MMNKEIIGEIFVKVKTKLTTELGEENAGDALRPSTVMLATLANGFSLFRILPALSHAPDILSTTFPIHLLIPSYKSLKNPITLFIGTEIDCNTLDTVSQLD